jgi:hypothetical protein
LTTSDKSTIRGRLIPFGAGGKAAVTAHSSERKSRA